MCGHSRGLLRGYIINPGDDKMSEQVWYIYHNQQQLGPFEGKQVVQLYESKMVAQDAYVFKVGWKDWHPIEDSFDELGIQADTDGTGNDSTLKRRLSAPRASMSGRIIVHNNGQLVIGSGVNISATGIFIETKDTPFKLGEKLKLTCKVDGLEKQFNAHAEVVRVNNDDRYPVGYGLRFEEIDPGDKDKIQALVDKQNIDEIAS